MKQYLKLDPWSIVEERFDPHSHVVSESVFSIGNGHMGQRANFEEAYSGQSLQGSYMAGVYYPDKTRVGWWKNGYPEYFAKVLNATNWIGLDVRFGEEQLDLARCEAMEFRRELNMKEGYLRRAFVARFPSGKAVRVDATRFVSIVAKEIGAVRYSVTPLNFDGQMQLTLFLDGDVKNKDANYDEQFWDEVLTENTALSASVLVKTKKLDFQVCSTMRYGIEQDGRQVQPAAELVTRTKYAAHAITLPVRQNQATVAYKYVANVTSRDHAGESLLAVSKAVLDAAYARGFDALLDEHAQAWDHKWQESDIIIDGDVAAQQGIRFNIFQLNQTYSGEDPRLNIGPKGFTGEKYGGSTYWDTEAFCLPFFLSTAEPHIARNLLIYRYRHLEQARENARKLGFTKGALYPMVTMNGEECHNEWEITFEEIHRNGAIAYAIYNYVNYTGDQAYLGEYGLEVLVEISRFWAERVQFAPHKGYVLLGVTGPNEYENNVNNNWYTNRIAAWTLAYTLETLAGLEGADPARYTDLVDTLGLLPGETARWQEIIAHMYYPMDGERGIFLQQDGFLDKDLTPVRELDPRHLPINQKWSWDRILRSCYIKQADVLQGLYFLGDQYDLATKQRNFDFYEPITVHESSLSPCVHCILACELGYREKAYEMYLRTSRLDLDNYNNDTEDGLHITSMGGTWMSVVQGFGGLRARDGKLVLNPFIPGHWESFSFKVMFRGARLLVTVKQDHLEITNETGTGCHLTVRGSDHFLTGKAMLNVPLR
ncbi:MAG TPA: glycoside hydrolase family 65 protein [Symbiobacteriaceae bacterium]|nr:glycoside hydrolase family 65 protein [Symbiobacteriaceae bacterium]